MLSAIVYLVLGTMLARMERRRPIKIYFIGVAVLLTTLVGLSRIYLGVHYPSDVLGGWSAGLAWAIVWWFIARYFERRGLSEPAPAKAGGQRSADKAHSSVTQPSAALLTFLMYLKSAPRVNL